MSTTQALVMQDDKRVEASRRPTLRLPAIAPKDDNSSGSASSSRSGPTVPPRARLPPRSRTGCWTCRTRKVKCDEGRPVCGQCSRLGHHCDYNPRLAFRDDTPRILERMQDVTIVASSVWDPNSPVMTETSAGSGLDELPPFATLITDEDRERKAERASPGTYNVVVNPDSFQHLPEYNDDPEVKRELLSPIRRGSLATSLGSSFSRETAVEGVAVPGDPNIVVLPRFEDISRRGTFSSNAPKSPISPMMRHPIFKTEDSGDTGFSEESGTTTGSNWSGQETRYLHHFRQVVWKQLVPVEPDYRNGISRSSVHVLEETAARFPPLHHAIMAVSTQSLAAREGKEKLDALQHYQQVLPALQLRLRSPDDLSSDGAFLTHFLLLVYEIAAADAEHSHIWSQHLSTLVQISHLRRQLFGGETFPYVLWWICNIDLDALLSGAGNGEFVASMLNNDMVPPPSFHLYPLGLDGSSVVYADEVEILPTVLQLDYEVTVLAIRLALLAFEFRHDTTMSNTDVMQEQEIRIRQSRIFELQEALRQLWIPQAVIMINEQVDCLPERPRQLYQHAATLYRACIIYSHTSMWPGQRLETSPDYDTEIAVASNQILQMTRKALASGRSDCRYLVLPLFLAGFVATNGAQRMSALDLLRTMEKNSIGRNTTATRKALAAVFEKQNERFMNTGQSLDIDWMEVMVEKGLMVVNFGL